MSVSRHAGDCVGTSALNRCVFRIPVAHATGQRCDGLPALTKCATSNIAIQASIATTHESKRDNALARVRADALITTAPSIAGLFDGWQPDNHKESGGDED